MNIATSSLSQEASIEQAGHDLDYAASSDSSSLEENQRSSVNPSVCDDAKEAQQVRAWSEQVPIGMGFCPWAVQSKYLAYRLCDAIRPQDVAERVQKEARHLLSDQCNNSPLSSTLLVCPRVTAWQDHFETFDAFVKSLRVDAITLVSFHPQFLRWRGLPSNITVGNRVQSHRNVGGTQKTHETFRATLLGTSTVPFGRRKVRIRFDSDGKAQYVPVDWIKPISDNDENDTTEDNAVATLGTPLPDNLMHRAPFPTIHLIRDMDLASLPMRSVSLVKRKNAQRIAQLGWEGMATSSTSQAENDEASNNYQ